MLKMRGNGMYPSNKAIIIPIDSLQKAEQFFPEISELVAPYLEGAKDNKFLTFYDELLDIVERTRSDAVITDPNGEKIVNNFEQICDDAITAINIIKPFLEKEDHYYNGYEYEYSNKIDDSSVVVKMRALK